MRQLPDVPAWHRLATRHRWWLKMIPSKVLCGLTLVVAIALSGCVQSDLGIEFQSPTRGEILHRIEFGERLQNLSGERLQQWMRQVEQAASTVGGKVQTTSNQSLTVKIPFTSSDDLEKKFNQFYGAVFAPESLAAERNLPAIAAQLTVHHSNFLLLERTRLTYAVDLRSLGVLSSTGDVLLSPAALIELQFQLKTPWGARNMTQASSLRPQSLKGGKILIWTLVPGQQTAIETVFWMPNPLGIGALVILFLVLLGQFLKKSPPVEVNRQAVKISPSQNS